MNFAATMDPPVIVNIEQEPAPPQVIIAFFSDFVLCVVITVHELKTEHCESIYMHAFC